MEEGWRLPNWKPIATGTESSENGILKKILVDLNEAVPIGNPIAIVAEADEDISALLPVTAPRQTEPDVSQPTNQQVPPIATALQSMDKPINPLSAQPLASAASDSSRVFITPSASRIAVNMDRCPDGGGVLPRIIKGISNNCWKTHPESIWNPDRL